MIRRGYKWAVQGFEPGTTAEAGFVTLSCRTLQPVPQLPGTSLGGS